MSAGTITRDGPPPPFTLFPNLPIELRTKIWKCALPGPRIIQLHNIDGHFFFLGARAPSALYTCRNSREEALSVFEPAFAHDKLPPIYIDLAHDTLHLAIEPKMFADACNSFPDLKEKIQSLAVEISPGGDLETLLIAIKRLSPRKLREIILIVGQTEFLKLSQIKYPEHVRFSEVDSHSWQIWKDVIARVLEGCVVRVVEAKVVF